MTLPKFQVGDYADHKYADLDPRPVVAVEGTKIRLQIGTVITDPVPMSNYRRIPARTFTVRSDDHSNHNLPIGATVTFHRYYDGVNLYTQGGGGDEVAIDPRDLEV